MGNVKIYVGIDEEIIHFPAISSKMNIAFYGTNSRQDAQVVLIYYFCHLFTLCMYICQIYTTYCIYTKKYICIYKSKM